MCARSNMLSFHFPAEDLNNEPLLRIDILWFSFMLPSAYLNRHRELGIYIVNTTKGCRGAMMTASMLNLVLTKIVYDFSGLGYCSISPRYGTWLEWYFGVHRYWTTITDELSCSDVPSPPDFCTILLKVATLHIHIQIHPVQIGSTIYE